MKSALIVIQAERDGLSTSPCLHVLACLYFSCLFLISEALLSKKSTACLGLMAPFGTTVRVQTIS